MGSPSPKRLKIEIVKVESEGNDDDSNQYFPKLPAEIWTMIFEMVKNAQGERKDKNKTLTELQLVCKFWHTIIKNGVFFEPKIGEELINGYMRFENVKVQKCALANLTMEPSAIAGINEPKLIKEIILCENVNKSNFLAVATNLKCVESVTITQEFLDSNDDFFGPSTEQEKNIFNQFWSRITKLELDFPRIYLKRVEIRSVKNLINFLESVHVTNLIEFKLTAHWRLIMDELPFSFLFRHKSSLAIVHIKLAQFRNKADLQKMSFHGRPKNFVKSNLKFIQLKKLTLEGAGMDRAALYTWTPLIESQKGLAHLELCNIYESKLKKFDNLFSFISLVFVGLRNRTTLTSIHLNQFYFRGEVSLFGFHVLKQLKYLTLDKKEDCPVTKLTDMRYLPESLEVLIVGGLSCKVNQLLRFARAPHLKKLRYFQLDQIDSREKMDIIPERLVQAFQDLHGSCEMKFI